MKSMTTALLPIVNDTVFNFTLAPLCLTADDDFSHLYLILQMPVCFPFRLFSLLPLLESITMGFFE